MKIDRGRIKKSTSEVPPECYALIEKLRSCSRRELLEELKKIDTWTFGKCELYHWIDILDLCDSILEAATARVSPKSWQIACDLPENHESKELLLWVLHFTTLLIEHSFSRHLYNSVEHLLTLLSSCDLNVVLGVLNLLYMFSKRSNFITRINPEMRSALLKCLTYLAESWGGRENGFGLADCVREETDFPATATTLHYEFYTEDQGATSQASCIHLDNVDQINKLPSEIMDGLTETFNVPKDGHMLLFTHLRLAHSFSNHSLRLKCVQARLQALSVLLYSNADSHNLLYPGILDELVQLLELNNPGLVEIRSAALRTLTSIIHLDRSPHLPKKPGSRLNMIIDVTGAGLYHGFLPQLVRSCITSLTSDSKEGEEDQFPLPLATALFSFLYHLASYEAGGEALVSCGMMECLLRVINWPGVELEHITFVTRAVRVIDLITNIDMQSFQSHGGLNSFINRLQMEMAICRQEQPFEIQVPSQRPRSDSTVEGSPTAANTSEATELDEEMVRIANSVDRVAVDSDSCSCSKDQMPEPTLDKNQIPDDYGKSNKTCLPQRAALLKSMLNFLKKALQDPAFTESIRHVMDGSLPSSLKHIISNAEYYGPSLFLLATDVVAVYVFQEPSLLSSLQDVGITEVVLHALLIKNVPATREVLGSVPNVFSALCLNQRGLQSFIKYKPFEKLFKVLLSPNYLSAMRRRRSSDPIGDTASNLGNAMDELMRHQPTLKSDAIAAIIKLLQELCQLGRDPKYVCWKPQKGSSNESPHPAPRVSNEAGSSDEEEEDEEEASTSSHPQPAPEAAPTTAFSEKTPIALVDYILNVMKFVDAILSNNSTDDHCREFVNQNGLVPLLSILGLPNLPVDYPITPAAQAVASVCKSVLNLAHERQVMRVGLTQLSEVLSRLGPLCTPHHSHSGSILLEELARAPCIDTAFSEPSATPLLHAMAATHGYVIMFVHVCRTGQLDIRTISMTNWGSELGLSVLSQLADLYTALVWESTVLLALCSEDSSREFNKEDIAKIYPPSMMRMQAESMEVSTEGQEESMEVDDDKSYKTTNSKPTPLIPQNIKLKYIKPLLGASSRLGRALAELFGLLVKLCVGFPVRTRRGNHLTNTPVSPSPWALAVSNSLAALLARGLNHSHLPDSSVPKFKLTYLICSVGFTQPMLFDEKRYPYHLMLLKFVRYKGQGAFFETFKWALSGGGKFPPEVGLNHEELPEGTGEFLDAWLLLLEKMVNPKAILESTHTLTTRLPPFNIRFEPLTYLQQVHKMAFEALSYLWGRKPLPTYGARMTETMLTIYRHIVRGEKIVEERKQKDTNETANVLVNPAAGEGRRGASGRERPEVNSTELSQLMDMGFSREHCYEALILTSSLEHATDYLLNNFFPHNVQPTQASEGTEEAEEPNEPLTKEALDEFSNQVLRVCLDYVEKLPETVYRVCDLLTIIIRRNGEAFCYKLLNTLAEETIQNVHLLLDQLRSLAAKRRLDICDGGSSNINVYETVHNSPHSIRIAGNLHLFMLLFEEIKVPCAKVVHGSNLLNVLVRLLVEVTDKMEEGAATPKWMAPLLLLIDLLDKVSVCVTRKVNMHKVTTQVWRWLDLASGRWSLYLPHNNKLINEAYWRGDRDVTITSGRRRYTIAFASMCQINDDSGKARPVMMTLIDPKDPTAKSNYDNQPTDLPPYPTTVTNPEDKDPNDTVESLSEPEYYVDFFHRRVGLQPIAGVNPQDIQTILRCCMQLISKPVDPDTLHAVMQVCVRFTRDYDNARLIAEMGAVKRLLKLRQVSSFNGFVGLSTMLIRHILEEPANITAAIERVIRFKTLPNIPPTFKELHYILRECAPAICRDPEIFKSVAKEIMRVDVSVLNKRSEEDDPRLLMKCLPSDNQKNNREVDRLVKKTITQLLNFLVEARQEEMGINDVIPDDDQSCDGTLPPPGGQPADALHFDENISSCSTVRNDRDDIDLDTFNASNLPMYIAASGPISSSSVNKKQSSSNGQQKDQKPDNLIERKKKLPLLLISYILKILGDAVRSYTCIAKMITDHKFSAKQSEILKEDCSAVAFVLDHLMPYRELNIQVDPDRPNMARNLIAALASCNHSPEAQCALVSEVKAALQRALAWPESAKKHTHIQDLVGVVTTMIDNCPPVPISSTPLSPALKLNQYSVNNMVRFMMRKGIVTDLARIPHSLDLSSPKMAATINASLKPLETLSRIMGQPSAGPTPSKAKPKGSATTATTDDAGSTLAASVQSEANQPTQMDQSGTAAGGEEDNPDMIDDHPILNEVMNSVVERVNEMEDLMQNVIERRRIPNLNNSRYSPRRNRRSRGQRRVISASELSRFTSSLFTSNNDALHFSTNEETSQDSSSDDSDSNPTDEERHMEDAATDIDDHVEDEDDDDDEEEEEDDEEDDDDDDDDDDQEGEENEGEESNGGYDEDGLELFEPDEGLFRLGLDRDSDDFLMIEYSEPDPSAPLGQPWSRDNFLPFTLFEEGNNASDNSGSRGSSIPTQHPLLMARNTDSQPSTTSGNRTQRMSRTRRYQYVQMNRAAVAAPVFLQRLMGQSNSEPPNYLNIPGHPGNTYGEMLASTFPNTRLIVMDNGLGILTNSEEEQINFVDQSGYLLGPSLAATLNNVPTSMYWWNEELRLLDRDSICDCSICVGFELVPIFEQYRNEEFAERKEKRKKMDDEDDNNKKANTSNGETEKKKLYDGIMDMFDSPRPPARMPTRRIAMLAAAQEVAHATESLAGSIVESVLHPRVVQPPGSRPLLPIQPPVIRPTSPDHPPPGQPEEQESSDVLVVPFVPPRRAQAPSIPEALELIPVAPPVSELSDPMGLIPGSVPYPPPSDPEDGFFRVNPTLLGQNDPAEARTGDSSEEARNSNGEGNEPRSEGAAPNTEQRALGPLPVDMSPSSTSSQSLFVDSPAGMAALSQSSQNTSQDLFVDSPAGLTTASQPAQRNEALEIEMAANWLQSVTGGQGSSPTEEERFNCHFGEQPTQPAASDPQPQTPVQPTESPEYPPPPPPPMAAALQALSEPASEPSSQPSMSSQGASLIPEEIPEGVDPSFLAALPEDMRAEVISEHLRLQRLQNRVQQSTSAGAAATAADDAGFPAAPPATGMEVNADFLAALPPAIQEEVLAQQRLEQQRQAAALSNPNDPVDAAAFFQDLPHSLRQAILTDMEESQISVLPPELAAEAQNLRREWEARNRQLMQERFLSHVTHSTSALSSILRHTSTPRNLRRPTGPRYTIQNMGPGNRTHWLSSWNLGARLLDSTQSSSQTSTLTGANLASAGNIIGRPRGRQVLDYESICCLLVLLFVDDSRLNTARLHRVFRNLCYHPPTREWVIRAILSIMEKSNEGQSILAEGQGAVSGASHRPRSQSLPSPEPPAPASAPTSSTASSVASRSGSSWLNISMDAALGCRATVFHVHKNPGRRNDRTITINQQAAPFVYRHALEILISLARIFPSYFVPGKPQGGGSVTASPPKATKSPRPDNSPNFWDLLIRLDSLSTSKKGKAVTRQTGAGAGPVGDAESLCLESSPFGQLLRMLASPVVHRSPLLMDKLLRLLSLISISLQVHRQRLWDRLNLQVEVNPTTLHHLGLAIDVLTSNTCSEEGLEDATALLLNMTVNLPNTRETVLNLLLNGARQMATMVCVHIEQLLLELRVLNSQQAQNEDLEDNLVDSRITSLKGILSNRFTKDTVVVTAPKKVKAGLDLQLNSMAPLISKTSSQAFFLRILKVIVQLRESVRTFDKKKRKQATDVAQQSVSEQENLSANAAADTASARPAPAPAPAADTAMDTTQAAAPADTPAPETPSPPLENAMDTNQSSQGSTSSSADLVPGTPPGDLARWLRPDHSARSEDTPPRLFGSPAPDHLLEHETTMMDRTNHRIIFLHSIFDPVQVNPEHSILVDIHNEEHNWDWVYEQRQGEDVELLCPRSPPYSPSYGERQGEDVELIGHRTPPYSPSYGHRQGEDVELLCPRSPPYSPSYGERQGEDVELIGHRTPPYSPSYGHRQGEDVELLCPRSPPYSPSYGERQGEDVELIGHRTPPYSPSYGQRQCEDVELLCPRSPPYSPLYGQSQGEDVELLCYCEHCHHFHNVTDEEGGEDEDNPQDTSSASDVFVPASPPSTSGNAGGEQPAVTAQAKPPAEEDTPLPPLSEQLNLDVLWNTLSECLTELQHTNDNHAVLVLQPAVEAFFLVHASGMEKTDQKTEARSGSEQPIVIEETPASASSQPPPQSLGLELPQAPPPVSPLPSDSSASQPSTSNYFPAMSTSQEAAPPVPPHQLKFLKFAETHRTVLNQILRQCTTPLLEGPFAVLVNHTRVLDFDVKRRYFRGELERADEGHRREELAVHVRRTQVFEDSFRELHRRSPEEWKNRFYIVFEGEEGQDAGGLLREWYMIISREIFNPMYALFTTSPGDRVTYMINPSSHCNPNHLCYFKFVGRVIAKAIYDNKLLECYFTRSFYKHILGILVKYTDMESEDYSFYKGLVYLMENHVDMLGYELTFSTEVQEFGVTDVRDLLPNGRNIVVTEENKMEYIRLVCQMKMTGAIRKQLNAFLEGFYDIIPKRLISIFNEQELELLISGLPNVDIEDLKANTEYYKYQQNSLQIQWFWRALREFDQAERAKFLQFVTGTSKVPLQGFAALEGMNGVQKFQIHRDERSTDRLPSAHTCFNQLDLPVYETYTKLRTYLLKAIHECSEGFGFA